MTKKEKEKCTIVKHFTHITAEIDDREIRRLKLFIFIIRRNTEWMYLIREPKNILPNLPLDDGPVKYFQHSRYGCIKCLNNL